MQLEPFEEQDFALAIEEIQDAEKKYDPSLLGYRWDDTNPKIQQEPIGSRGYIELVAICEDTIKTRKRLFGGDENV